MKHFLHKLLLLYTLVTITSCTTILHRKNQRINVFSNAENAEITVNDSVYTLPAKIKLVRDKKPVTISYRSTNKQFDSIIKSKISPVFSAINLTTIPAFGAGYLVDLTNKKRFAYPKNIFFNDKDSLEIYEQRVEEHIYRHNITDQEKIEDLHYHFKRSYFKEERARKLKEEKNFKRFNPTAGTFKIFIAPPTLSLVGFSSKNPNIDQFSNFVGGIGFGFGFDYYYKNNRFVSMELSNRANQFEDFYWSSHDVMAHKLDFSLRKGHRIHRFEYSYGVSITYTNYKYSLPFNGSPIKPFMSDDERRHFTESYKTAGFSSLINYQITPIMYIGIRYNPAIYSFRKSGNGFDYEHVIGLDYRLKF